jgi:hypothetical protein
VALWRLQLISTLLAGVVLATAATAAGADPPRPMSGDCATTFTVQPTGAIAITGTCQLAHLGRSAYEAVQTVVPNPDGTVAITVTGFYTAANGDRLFASIIGTGRFTGGSTVAYTTTETYAGGTGRFAHASGVVTDVGLASFTGPTTGTSSYTTTGSIAY